jgi:hypothetical protein
MSQNLVSIPKHFKLFRSVASRLLTSIILIFAAHTRLQSSLVLKACIRRPSCITRAKDTSNNAVEHDSRLTRYRGSWNKAAHHTRPVPSRRPRLPGTLLSDLPEHGASRLSARSNINAKERVCGQHVPNSIFGGLWDF